MATKRQLLGLVAWVLGVFIVAWFGAIFTPGPWYDSLDKPTFNPPSWIFGPVWTTLYLLMAIAAFMIWDRHGFSGARAALTMFIVQLIFNGLWSWLFFGLNWMGVAFVDIVLLWLAILATIVLFWKKKPFSGVLLLPYLAWVTFAAVLNFTLWQMNT